MTALTGQEVAGSLTRRQSTRARPPKRSRTVIIADFMDTRKLDTFELRAPRPCGQHRTVKMGGWEEASSQRLARHCEGVLVRSLAAVAAAYYPDARSASPLVPAGAPFPRRRTVTSATDALAFRRSLTDAGSGGAGACKRSARSPPSAGGGGTCVKRKPVCGSTGPSLRWRTRSRTLPTASGSPCGTALAVTSLLWGAAIAQFLSGSPALCHVFASTVHDRDVTAAAQPDLQDPSFFLSVAAHRSISEPAAFGPSASRTARITFKRWARKSEERVTATIVSAPPMNARLKPRVGRHPFPLRRRRV